MSIRDDYLKREQEETQQALQREADAAQSRDERIQRAANAICSHIKSLFRQAKPVETYTTKWFFIPESHRSLIVTLSLWLGNAPGSYQHHTDRGNAANLYYQEEGELNSIFELVSKFLVENDIQMELNNRRCSPTAYQLSRGIHDRKTSTGARQPQRVEWAFVLDV